MHLIVLTTLLSTHALYWRIKIASAGKVLFEAVSSFWTHQRGYTSSDFHSLRVAPERVFTPILANLVTAGCLQPLGASPGYYAHFIECDALGWALDREVDEHQLAGVLTVVQLPAMGAVLPVHLPRHLGECLVEHDDQLAGVHNLYEPVAHRCARTVLRDSAVYLVHDVPPRYNRAGGSGVFGNFLSQAFDTT